MAYMTLEAIPFILLNKKGKAKIKNYIESITLDTLTALSQDPEFKYSGIDLDSVEPELWRVRSFSVALLEEIPKIPALTIYYDAALDKYLVQAAIVLTFKFDPANPVYNTIVNNFSHQATDCPSAFCIDKTGVYFRDDKHTHKKYADGPRLCFNTFIQVVLDNTEVDKIDF